MSLNSHEYDLLDQAFINVANGLGGFDIRHWRLLIRISKLMAMGRKLSASGQTYDTLVAEAQELRHSMDIILAEMQSSYEKPTSRLSELRPGMILHAVRQRGLGVAMASKAILLCACRTLLTDQSYLDADAAQLCKQVLDLIEYTKIYRPLGAIWTVHTMICLWCAVHEVSLRAKVEAALLDYQRDAMGPSFQLQLDQLNLLEQRLSLH